MPLFTLVLAATLSAWLVNALRPLLQRYAMVPPNIRSSHTTPTPQGAGFVVIAATITAAAIAIVLYGNLQVSAVINVFIATIFIAIVGAVDDLKPIPVLPRLIAHAIAVSGVLLSLPSELQIFPHLPLWIERGLLLIAGIWFVNLVNFMDGLDWMTVAEAIPIAATLSTFGMAGHLPPVPTLTTAALAGAMVGFAPFNRPVAKIFLGDVGSLPIGLLLAWALLELAAQGHVVAAVLLPLYYLADATVTLVRRALNRERIWIAHRTHYYQRATDNGLAVIQVITSVFFLNLALAALAIATIVWTWLLAQLALLALGSAAVAVVLMRFGRSPRISTRL